MQAIRNMEPAWEKVNGRKFALVVAPALHMREIHGLKFQPTSEIRRYLL